MPGGLPNLERAMIEVMKVFIFSQDEPFFLPRFFETILRKRAENIEGIVLLSLLPPGANRLQSVKKIYNVYGPCTFFRQGMSVVKFRILDRLNRLRLAPRKYSVTAIAQKYGIPVYRPDNINSEDFRSFLKEREVDLILSASATQIFKSELLAIPKLGAVNLHGGMLPRYRGMMPSFWAMLNNEEYVGVTVHYMTAKLDDGDIILQEKLEILSTDTLASLISRSKALGAELMLKAMGLIENGNVNPKPNRDEFATYFSFPDKADGEKFREMGRKFR